VYQQQNSLLEDPLKPIDRPTHSFSYEYTCDGHPHRHQIQDWEVQAAFMHYKRRYKTEAKALEMMTQEYQDNIPTRNLHFIMGTMKAHPRTFILIGLRSVDIIHITKRPVLSTLVCFSRLLKKSHAAQSGVNNWLTMLMYWRVHCACSPIFALSCTRLRLFQQPVSI